MTTVSISIPVYNVAPWLRRCLDSLLKQSLVNWEAVCVDDGSTDGSGEILDEYAKLDYRFKVIHQANRGVNFARQAALDASTGEYLASVDGDDWVEPDFLKHLLDAAKVTAADIVIADYFEDENDNSIRCSQEFAGDGALFQERLLSGLWGCTWNKLFSRSFVVKNGVSYPNAGRIYACEDLCFCVAAAAANPKIQHVDACDYHYCLRSGSAIRSNSFGAEKFLGGVIANDYLMRFAVSDVAKRFVKLRNVQLKFNAYSIKAIDDRSFFFVHPEIRNINELPVSSAHKLLFWLSVRGCRRVIVIGFNVFRWLKSLSNIRFCICKTVVAIE